MRLSEKTIELTFCHQFGVALGRDLVWFGLTQRQEAVAGFDACVRMNGRLLILQFKALSKMLVSGRRQFVAPHTQMEALRERYNGNRSIFYALPFVGNTSDVYRDQNILSRTWLLDVADLPDPIPDPVKRDGTPRKSENHYISAEPGWAVIHSEPFKVPLLNGKKLAPIAISEEQEIGVRVNSDNQADLTDLLKHFHRDAFAIIL